MSTEVERPGVSLGQFVRVDRGSYNYLNQFLEEFKNVEDFLTSFAFGKRPVEKEFQMILDQYFNKDLQEFYNYLVDSADTVCEVSGRGHIKDMLLSTTVSKDRLELDDVEVVNGEELFEMAVLNSLCYSDEVTETGYVEISDIEIDGEFLRLPHTVNDPELKDIIYGQEVVV